VDHNFYKVQLSAELTGVVGKHAYFLLQIFSAKIIPDIV